MGLLGCIVGCCNSLGVGRLKTKFRSLTDRQYLITNNVFVLVCSLYQCVVGLGIVLAFNHNFRKSSGSAGISNVEERNAGTQSYMAQCIIGGYLTIISIMGIRAAHKVNIQMLIWYYWLSLVAIPLLFLFSVISLDFKDLLEGWISHRWDRVEFDFLRRYFCEPDTWDNKCTAPIKGGPGYDTTEEWCISEYNAKDCKAVRDAAEEKFLDFMGTFCNFNGVVGIVNMLLLLMSLKLVERTLTLPVIMSSMLDAINWLLFLPIAFCIAIGFFFNEHDELQVGDVWLKYLFFINGGCMFFLALLGIFASREKLRGVLKFYALAMGVVVLMLGLACASSFVFAWQISQIYGVKGDGKVGEVACRSELYGCCCCEYEDGVLADEELCPEWTREEIVHVVEADFKMAGLVAAISCLFAIRATRACTILIHNLKDYKCVYL
ncbi:hypothetical protein TrCOL_g6622 [Triparma columacea]|uniref:Uncharacterized protein n=1 Tax=Triparma columacea TaxID=722753 RepID=A0A9W7G1L6_9STRA|nr:hypothetical protein TrCOL_g6622 [Triparma columacea]